MPAEITNAGAVLALDATTGRASSTAATRYLALLTAAPTDTTTLAGLAEVTTAGYSRLAPTWTAPSSGGGIQLNGVLSWNFTANTPSITHVALVTAQTGTTGSVLAIWTLNTPVTRAAGEALTFGPGDLTLDVNNLHTAAAARALNAVTGRAAVSTDTRYLLLSSAALPALSTTYIPVVDIVGINTNGYIRQVILWTAPGGDPLAASGSQVTFGPFTGPVPTVTHAWLVDAASGSTQVMTAWPLPESLARAYASGESLVIPSGELQISFD